MNIELDVKMDTKTMYNFLMYHAYRRSNGWLGPIMGVFLLTIGFTKIEGNMPSNYIVWFLFGILFLLYTPVGLYLKAKSQAMKPMFQKTVHYVLNEEGLFIHQDEEQVKAEWEELQRVVATRKNVIIYAGRTRAIILPLAAIGEQYDQLKELLVANMTAQKVKLK